jgi:hypothetical protein
MEFSGRPFGTWETEGGDTVEADTADVGRFKRKGETSLLDSSLIMSVQERGRLNADAQK